MKCRRGSPRTIRLAGLAFSVLFLGNAFAILPPGRPELPNFDKRSGGAAAVAAGERRAPMAQLSAQIHGARIDFDEVVGTPKWIASTESYLSGPGGNGKGISAGMRARFPANDPYRTLKAFLAEHSALFGHGPEVLETARIKREFVTPHNGLKTVVWEQQLDGIDVFEALLISHTSTNDELVGVSSRFIPAPAPAANKGAPNRAALVLNPTVSAIQAVTLAARELGQSLSEAEVSSTSAPDGAEKRQFFRAQGLNGETEARLVWLPMDDSSMRLCWEIILTSHERGEMFKILIDAENGEALVRHCLTDYLSDATYRVYTSDSPSPFSPGNSTPVSTQPPLVSRSLVTLSALDTNASPAGWMDDGVNETRGNNVDAHTDWDADNIADLPRPQGSPFRVFDFSMDLTQAPHSYSNAAVVQVFYWNNFMHDKLYELGFTEAAGNFQNNNFGRGGLGNDAVQADAQDGSGTDNANFSTPPDGSPGRMQMYVFTGPTPNRDGDLDAEVVLHEYTHGLSNRRVGGGVGISALQTGGMGEGWSDFYAMSLLSESGDDVNGVYASGGYATYLLGGMTQNYYFGIRRYPYCTDTNKNPLTFKDIDPAQASAHTGIPRSPIIGTTANEVHNMGEVWCVTLWDARANLINKYGWAVGNQLMLQLVTDGMNLSPANPTFLQARDAILQADQVDNGGLDLTELWTGFARRGMGKSATSPSSSTTTGLHEAYDIPFQPLQVAVPASATEGDGVLIGAGQARLPFPVGTNVVISLSSSDTSEVTVAASVTVLAGQSNAVFDLTIIDDGVLDGTQPAMITASAPGFANGYGTISVFDNETATLQVALPASATEGQGTVQGTVQVSATPAANIAVSLSSSHTTEIQVPASAIIPAGQTSAAFTATVVDDNQIDGTQMATVTAHVQNWTDGRANIMVLDNENLNLAVNLPASASESAGVLTNAGSISISGTLPADLVVSLVSSNIAKLTVPSTVTIPAGQVSNRFNLTLVDNAIPDGHQTVIVTASATGFTNGSASVFIIDDESPPPPSNPRPGNLAVNSPANTNLMWNNGISGELITNGGFETGTFAGWLKQNSSAGDFVINNGSYDPPGSEAPTPPFAGSFSAESEQTGAGTHVIYQDINLPPGATSAILTWTDRIRNFGAQFAANQYFHVEIRGTNDSLIQLAFTTSPGNPLLNNWSNRTFNLAPYIGRTIRIAFVEVDNLGYFNVHLDNISVQMSDGSSAGVTNDVYFGTNPTPGPTEFQGNTTNSSWALPLLAPLTTYYWQIITHKGGTATGPVWQFTTAGVDHFVWNPVYSPQVMNQPISVTVTARDAFNTTVSNFTGRVGLSGWNGSSGPGQLATFDDLPGGSLPVPAGYCGLTWSNFNYLIAADHPNSGYSAGTVSPPNAAFNPYGTPASIINTGKVNLVSAYLTAAWNDNLQVLANGYAGATLAYSNSYTLSATAPTLINFNYLGVSKVDFISSGGTPHPGYSGSGTQFVVDNVVLGGSAASLVSIIPTNTENFVNGIWTGNITVLQPATNVVLQADDGSNHTGSSSPFDVNVTNDISIRIVDSPHPVSAGANLTYTIIVANSGPSDATDVMVTNILPGSVLFVSATSSQGTCAQASGVVTCDLGVLPGKTNATVTIIAVPTIAGATITNSATVTRAEADAYLGNNTAVATTPVTTPAISITDAAVVEGNVGTTNILFDVTLAAPSAQTVTVNYATTNGSAAAAGDYVSTNGVLTFPPGTTNRTIAVLVIGDTLIESNETFFVNLSNPVNGVLGRGQGVGTIINDDGLPGRLHHFAWNTIASPQFVNQPFGVMIGALDASNNPATNFNGTVNLSGFAGGSGGSNQAVRILSFILYADTTASGEYHQTLMAISNYFPNFIETSTSATDAATLQAQLADKNVFLIVEQETALAGTLGPLGTAWTSVLNDFVNRGGVVIACSWTTEEHLILQNSGLLNLARISAPASDTVTKGADHFLNQGIVVPFGGSYIGEYSTANGVVVMQSATTGVPVAIARDVGAGHVVMIGTDYFTLGTGMDRVVANAVRWAQLSAGNPIAVSPAVSGSFSNGLWSGNVTVLQPATNVALGADDGNGHTGSSNPFDVGFSTNQPTASDITASTFQNQPLNLLTAKLLALASDPNGYSLAVTGVSATSTNGGIVALATNQITYTPMTGYIGADRIGYTIGNGQGGSASAFVFVQVLATNQPSGNMLPLSAIPGGCLVSFAGIPGRTYTVQRAPSLFGPWTTLATVTVESSGIGTYSDTSPPAGSAFYRTSYP